VVNSRNFCLGFITGLSYTENLHTLCTVLDDILSLDLEKYLQGKFVSFHCQHHIRWRVGSLRFQHTYF